MWTCVKRILMAYQTAQAAYELAGLASPALNKIKI